MHCLHATGTFSLMNALWLPEHIKGVYLSQNFSFNEFSCRTVEAKTIKHICQVLRPER